MLRFFVTLQLKLIKIFQVFQKRKLILSFILLLSVITVLLAIPQTTSAFAITSTLLIITAVLGGLYYAGKTIDKLTDTQLAEIITASVVSGILWVVVGVSNAFSSIGAAVLAWVLADPFKVRYIPGEKAAGNLKVNDIVNGGWQICRDLGNTIIVLGFVVVAIATILRIREYEAQKLLFPLIIVAILINFSPLICGIIIDISNILVNFFLSGIHEGGGVASISGLVPTMEQQWSNITLLGKESLSQQIIMSGLFTVINLLTGYSFLLMSWIYLARYVVLWILVILSPLAFACYPIGVARTFFQRWWESFITWCFIGIPLAFIMFLAAQAAKMNVTPLTTGAEKGLDSALIQNISSLIVVSVMLIVGVKATKKLAGEVGTVGVKGMAMAGGFVLGGVAGFAGGAAQTIGKFSGATNFGQTLSSGAGRIAETMGWRPVGSTAEARTKREEEARKRAEKIGGGEAYRMLRSGNADERKGALSAFANNKDSYDKLTPGQRAYVEAKGLASGHADKFRRFNPVLAGQNNVLVDNEMRQNPNFSRPQAVQSVIRKSTQSLTPKEAGNLSSDVLRQPSIGGSLTVPQITKGIRYATPDRISAAVSHRGMILNQARAAGRGTSKRAELRKIAEEMKKLE